MNVALVQLINNDYVVCDLELLEEEPCYYMKNAYVIKHNESGKLNFQKYPEFTDDEGCLMHTDKIITMVDPKPSVVEEYMKVIGE